MYTRSLKSSPRRIIVGFIFVLTMLAAAAVPAWAAAETGAAAAGTGPDALRPLTNLSHLDRLTRDIRIGEREMAVTLIYSDYPDYEPVIADGEGMACVDDSARAAVVYLHEYESSKSAKALATAKKLLEFVMYMQDGDGAFYNFIMPDLSINRTGPTSRASLAWWSGRAVWALGLGVKAFKPIDPIFAGRIEACLQKTLDLIDGTRRKKNGGWLVNGESDVTSYYILGLIEWYRVQGSDMVREAIAGMSDAVAACQKGSFTQAPYGIIYGDPNSKTWHQWGSLQVQALASAAGEFPERGGKWLKAAAAEAESWFGDLLINGMVFEVNTKRREYPQIAYSVNVVVQGFYELYRATGNVKYGNLAGLAASWFLGGNPALTAMYDAATGRGYDGIDGLGRINRNSGAESTIEAVMTFQSLDALPGECRNYSEFIVGKAVTGTLGRSPESKIFGDLKGNSISLVRDPGAKSLNISVFKGK